MENKLCLLALWRIQMNSSLFIGKKKKNKGPEYLKKKKKLLAAQFQEKFLLCVA